MDGYYSEEELLCLGLKEVGQNVLISKKASIYTPSQIAIGHDVRIDDFCFLAGDITLGSYIHIAPYASIHGTGGGSVWMKDFTGLASYSTVYASSDDFSGKSIASPMVGREFESLNSFDIVFEKHAAVGLRSVVLPKAYLAEGVVVGAMSVLTRKTKPWNIYIGVPCKRIKERERKCLELEKIVRNTSKGGDMNWRT